MPAPIPLPLRQAIFQRDQLGQSVSDIAHDLELQHRSVRRLLRRREQLGTAALAPSYHTGRLADATPSALHQRVLQWRQDHPDWGAGLMCVLLHKDYPDQTIPSERTLQRWLRLAGLHPAPVGRRSSSSTYQRADKPHQRWQVDAAERMRLRSGQRVSWLRNTDECSGAVLGTKVFPPRALAAGAARSHARRVALRVHEVGPTAWFSRG